MFRWLVIVAISLPILLTSCVGETGPMGPIGPQSEKGEQGIAGEQGPMGIQGKVGPKGDRGEVGLQGIQGREGLQGSKGDKGDVGSQGGRGIQGEKGGKGEKGEQGEPGPMGEKGEKGEQGEPGAMGETGPIGQQGPQGVAGEDGKDVDPYLWELLDAQIRATGLGSYAVYDTDDWITAVDSDPQAFDWLYRETVILQGDITGIEENDNGRFSVIFRPWQYRPGLNCFYARYYSASDRALLEEGQNVRIKGLYLGGRDGWERFYMCVLLKDLPELPENAHTSPRDVEETES